MKDLTLVVKLTNQCNLNCVYCYDKNNREKISVSLSEKQIMVAAEKMLLNVENTNWIWHGGEPGVFGYNKIIELTEKIKELAKRYYSTINFSLQTNGTLLDEEILQKLLNCNIHVGVSYDGTKQKENRFVDLENNILSKCGIICVVDKNTELLENYLFLKNKQIPNLSFNMKFPTEKGIENWKDFLNFYFIDEQPIVESTTLNFIKKIINNTKKVTCDWDSCDNLFALREDGQLSYCDIDDNYLFGDFTDTEKIFIDDYLNTENYKKYLQDKIEFKNNCLKTCFLSDICSGCFSRIHSEKNVESNFCENRRQLFLYIKFLLHTTEIKNPLILELIGNYKLKGELQEHYDSIFND